MEPENTSNSTDGRSGARVAKNQELDSRALKVFVPMIFFREDSPLFVLQSFMQDSASP
jgi:hypothetical protein